MLTTSLTSKGQVTIPVELRVALGLTTGDQIAFQRQGNMLILKRRENNLKACFGILKSSKAVSLEDMERGIEEGATE